MFRAKSKRGFFSRWGPRRAMPAVSADTQLSATTVAAAASGRRRWPRTNKGQRSISSGSLSDMSSSSSSDEEYLDSVSTKPYWQESSESNSADGGVVLSASDCMELNVLIGQANDLLVGTVNNLTSMTGKASASSDIATFHENLQHSLKTCEKQLFKELMTWEVKASRGNAETGDPISELLLRLDQLDAALVEACRHLDEHLKPLLEFHERTKHISFAVSRILINRRVAKAANGSMNARDGGLIVMRGHR